MRVAVFDVGRLTRRLAHLFDEHGVPPRMQVGFSGGLDSAVLLHALVSCRPPADIGALHVNHGLHRESRSWADAAVDYAARLGVSCTVIDADVDPDAAEGLEAAARRARYEVFERVLGDGDWLLSAHHADDQAETLLLNLMRGSGPLGLAGMQSVRTLGGGLLVRPLLDVSRSELADYATTAGIDWTEDPSNADTRFDRNFLRHDIIPALVRRWPAAVEMLVRSAALAADSQQLLDELAAHDLAVAGSPGPGCLALRPFSALSRPRRRNLLRFACRQCGLPLPPAGRLESILDDVAGAAADAAPLVRWAGAEVRRFRGCLYLLPELPEVQSVGGPDRRIAPDTPLELGPGLGRLELVPARGSGIDAATAKAGLTVAFRRGGERLRPGAAGRTRDLKKLMQETGVLPWMRERIPLLYAGRRLVAVGDLWTEAAFTCADGYRVAWTGRPALLPPRG